MATDNNNSLDKLNWHIYSWMIQDRKLSGNELVLFSFFFSLARHGKKISFSQDELSYIIGVSRKTIDRIVFSLRDRNFIKVVGKQGQKFEYQIVQKEEYEKLLKEREKWDTEFEDEMDSNLCQNVTSTQVEKLRQNVPSSCVVLSENLCQNVPSTCDKMSQGHYILKEKERKDKINCKEPSADALNTKTDTEVNPVFSSSLSMETDTKTDTEKAIEKGAENQIKKTDKKSAPKTELFSDKLNRHFNTFIEHYPKSRATRNQVIGCRPLFDKAYQESSDFYPRMMTYLDNQKESQDWSNNDGQYIPSLVKFLSDKKWESATLIIDYRYTAEYEELQQVSDEQFLEELQTIVPHKAEPEPIDKSLIGLTDKQLDDILHHRQ